MAGAIGKVRGIGNTYVDGIERQEIHVKKADASNLPHQVGVRIPLTLVIDGHGEYEAGLRSTERCPVVWLSPDLFVDAEKVRLADVLAQAGFSKNDEIEIHVDGSRLLMRRTLA